MTIRRIREQLEAKLKSIQPMGVFSSGPSGKMEATWYKESERLEVKVRKLKLPHYSTADVFIDDQNLGSISIEASKGKIDTEGPSILPPLEKGQTVEIRYQGKALLRGQLYRD